jgi:O-antigen biosynthesis protein
MQGNMIDIIIVTLDRQTETTKTLEALFENNKDINVIIVDNGSDDLSYLGRFDVRVIKNNKNVGVPKAYNQGLDIATSKYIVLMHNDIVISTKDWIDTAVRFMDKNPKAGIVGQAGWKIITRDAKHGKLKTSIDHYRQKPNGFEQVSSVDGCCNMIRDIGLRLDEFLGYYYYDYDLSMEYRDLGYKLYVMDGSSDHLSDHKGRFEATINLDKCRASADRTNARNYFLNKWEGYLPVCVK